MFFVLKMPRRNLTNREKLNLINDVENNNLDCESVQKIYQISRATVYRNLAKKEFILTAVENGLGKRARLVSFNCSQAVLVIFFFYIFYKVVNSVESMTRGTREKSPTFPR